MRIAAGILLGWAVVSASGFVVRADEGMWTFDSIPVERIERSTGFRPDAAWIERVRLASVRINDGGSGAFVSPRGLLLTNQHLALGQLQKVSTPEKDYVRTGFYAPTEAQELKCPDLEVHRLEGMENVTQAVREAVAGLSSKKAEARRREVLASLASARMRETGLLCESETLYRGGEYWIYLYRRFTDIRLVFSTEKAVGFFGGDADNFAFPRHDLDVALFRVYDNGRPLEVTHYLPLRENPPSEGEVVFVAGNPGATLRLLTASQIETLRDLSYPTRLAQIEALIAGLEAYGARGTEETRRAYGALYGIRNARRTVVGELEALRDPDLLEGKRREERALLEALSGRPSLRKEVRRALREAARAEKVRRRGFKATFYGGDMPGGTLCKLALALVRYPVETAKPDGSRLEPYQEANLETLRSEILSPAPLHADLQEAYLATALEWLRTELGPDDPLVRALLDGESPQEVARKSVGGTRLGDLSVRKGLLDGGEQAVRASADPLLALARRADPILRERSRRLREEVAAPLESAAEILAGARFAVHGKSLYPDATFSPRLTWGRVAGYETPSQTVPPFTTFFGLYDRSAAFGGRGAYALPQRYQEGRGRLDLATVLNFAATCDTISGNSGSPCFDREGYVVGVVFDRNREGLSRRFYYDESRARCVAVASSAVLETLEALYDAGPLAAELRAASGDKAGRRI
ncbi:MAG: S46 family peptidase [Acidobacteriota bacterium]